MGWVLARVENQRIGGPGATKDYVESKDNLPSDPEPHVPVASLLQSPEPHLAPLARPSHCVGSCSNSFLQVKTIENTRVGA